MESLGSIGNSDPDEKARKIFSIISEVMEEEAFARLVKRESFLDGTKVPLREMMLNNALFSYISNELVKRLENEHVDYDSLDITEAYMMAIEELDEDSDDDSGGTGVREPRRPILPKGEGSMTFDEGSSVT